MYYRYVKLIAKVQHFFEICKFFNGKYQVF